MNRTTDEINMIMEWKNTSLSGIKAYERCMHA